MFEKQLTYLAANGYQSLTITAYLDAANKKSFPAKSLVFTFDDGYLDNYLNAFPLLKRYGFKGTFYVVSGKIGTDGYMTWAQLREMQAAGMEIGAHTMTHPFLTKLNPAAAWLEIYLSGMRISQELGSFPATFAYPYNDRNPRVEQLPRMIGFQAALAVSPHKGDVAGNLYTIPRITILRGETVRTLAMVVGRGY
jgi:peptidoglycan/xylan/chitin deacetylase (PgdA/CDA1 family)